MMYTAKNAIICDRKSLKRLNKLILHQLTLAVIKSYVV